MYELRCKVIFIFILKKLVSWEESRANRKKLCAHGDF